MTVLIIYKSELQDLNLRPLRPERSRGGGFCCRINALSAEKSADFKGFTGIWKNVSQRKDYFVLWFCRTFCRTLCRAGASKDNENMDKGVLEYGWI